MPDPPYACWRSCGRRSCSAAPSGSTSPTWRRPGRRVPTWCAGAAAGEPCSWERSTSWPAWPPASPSAPRPSSGRFSTASPGAESRAMTLEPTYVDFRPHDRAAVVARMADLARDRNGWVNLQPGVPEDVATVRPGLAGLLTGRSTVPLATWLPGEVGRRGVEPTTVGLQHAAGGKLVPL